MKIPDNQEVYLKNNVQVEPLINNWFAWYNIIPPVLTALNTVERYIPIMESYIDSPEVHAECVKNPAFKGGPFIDVTTNRAEEVRALLNHTKDVSKPYIDFVKAIRSLDKLLKEKAVGFKLEELYKQVPAEIKGYVELYYDRHHRPDFRFYEPLLYKSPFYIEAFQSIAFSLINNDTNRPFIFSTPRLNEPGTLNINIPFKSGSLDELFKMKRNAQPYGRIKQLVNITDAQESLFRNLFTTEKPKPYNKYTGDKVRIRYFGHACVLFETNKHSILIDPVLSYTYESDVPRFTYDDLPDEIDYILITHGHHDHILMETMLQLRHKVKNIVVGKNIDGAVQDPSIKLLFRNLGFKNVIEITELEQIIADEITITGMPFIGEHHDLHVNSKLGYHIKLRDYSIMAVADACNQSPELYEHIHNVLGDVDVLFMGMECDGAPATWVYGPVFTEQPERTKDHTRRGRGSNCKEGMDLVRRFNCKEVYVYAMGAEPWISYILDVHYTEHSNPIIESDKLIAECMSDGIVAERLFGERELFMEQLTLEPMEYRSI
jgi:L-ascorbate metabolism protein UlaG (beta-lactamase superfamily)